MRLTNTPNSATVALLLLWQYSTLVVVRAVKRHYTGKMSCYSCMTKDYDGMFFYVHRLYHKPAQFTNNCDPKHFHRKQVSGVRTNCTFCLNLHENQSFSGATIEGHIRGCLEDYKHINDSALYRYRRGDHCGTLERSILFGIPTLTGSVRLCSCHSSYCNGANTAAQLHLPYSVSATLCLALLTLSGHLQFHT